MSDWLNQQEIEAFPGLTPERRAGLVTARELGACVALREDPPECELSYGDDDWTASGRTVDDAALEALTRFDALLAERG